MLDKKNKILIIGLGLMGGSYARAFTEKGYFVGAIEKKESSLAYALEKGFIQEGQSEPKADLIGKYDILIFALYPHIFTEWVKQYQHLVPKGRLLTDVTGVKGAIAEDLQALLREDLEYIGAHPMAGREASGIENANTEMFRGANYIVTPTEKNTQEAIDTCIEIGKTLGFSTVSVLSPEKHDEMIGFLSQLTHCIAVSLMDCKDAEHLARYTGDSFRDLTRIAKINDEMWSELFLLNKKALLAQMDLFSEQFAKMRDAIAEDDQESLREMMRLSTERRTFFDKKTNR